MWEAIAANRRRSILIILVMGAVLVLLGASIGAYAGSQVSEFTVSNGGEIFQAASLGGFAASLVWLALWLMAVFQGDRVILQSAQAREIQKLDHPRLWNIVEEMTIAAGLPRMPRIYLISDPYPNAFAVGRKPEKAAVAVTSGLLRLLDRDELQGVIAHEIGHIRNLDIRFMTIAAVLVASVELVSRMFLYSGGRGRAIQGSASKGGGRGKGGSGPLLVIVVILVVLSPILVRLLYLATSRWREYLADASAARFTRYPEGLASALEKISAWYAAGSASGETSSALAALYIFNPVEKFAASSWFSTHPPTDSRIKILRGMGGRAGYVDYEAALRKIESRNLAALHAAAKSEASIAARVPSADPGEASGDVARAKEVADLLDYMAHYVVVHCACGMNIKLPPDSKQDRVMCPRCMLWHNVPAAVPAKTGAQAATPEVPAKELPAISGGDAGWKYERREEGREAFRCVCGQTIQIGPDYPLDYTVCVKCERRISLRAGQQAQATANVEPVA